MAHLAIVGRTAPTAGRSCIRDSVRTRLSRIPLGFFPERAFTQDQWRDHRVAVSLMANPAARPSSPMPSAIAGSPNLERLSALTPPPPLAADARLR